MIYYNLKKIPFLRVRVVLDNKECPWDITLKLARLYNLATKRIGATSIKIEKPGVPEPDDKMPAVVSSLDHFCGQYSIDWTAASEDEDESFRITLTESKMNSVAMAKKVFEYEDDVRNFEKTQSHYFDAKRIANYAMGQEAEEAAVKVSQYEEELKALHSKLQEAGIIRENFLYVPAYMYIFPKQKMDESYYKRATFFRIKWLTPNVCITQSSSFFRKYCEMSKVGSIQTVEKGL